MAETALTIHILLTFWVHPTSETKPTPLLVNPIVRCLTQAAQRTGNTQVTNRLKGIKLLLTV